MSKAAIQLVRVVLKSGKAVYLRKMKIADTENAARICARGSDGDANLLQMLMQKELAKLLIVKIGPNREAVPVTVSAQEKEDMDALFDMTEYSQVLKAIGIMAGSEDAGKTPLMEMLAAE